MESKNVRGLSYGRIKKVRFKKEDELSKVALLVKERPGLELDSQTNILLKVLLKVKQTTTVFLFSTCSQKFMVERYQG